MSVFYNIYEAYNEYDDTITVLDEATVTESFDIIGIIKRAVVAVFNKVKAILKKVWGMLKNVVNIIAKKIRLFFASKESAMYVSESGANEKILAVSSLYTLLTYVDRVCIAGRNIISTINGRFEGNQFEMGNAKRFSMYGDLNSIIPNVNIIDIEGGMKGSLKALSASDIVTGMLRSIDADNYVVPDVSFYKHNNTIFEQINKMMDKCKKMQDDMDEASSKILAMMMGDSIRYTKNNDKESLDASKRTLSMLSGIVTAISNTASAFQTIINIWIKQYMNGWNRVQREIASGK